MGHCSQVDFGLSFANAANGVLQLLYALMTYFEVLPYLAFHCILLTLSHAPYMYMTNTQDLIASDQADWNIWSMVLYLAEQSPVSDSQ